MAAAEKEIVYGRIPVPTWRWLGVNEVRVPEKVLREPPAARLVTIPAGGTPVTANLQGPLVINRTNNQCMQVILGSNKWTTKHDIMKALKAKDARGEA